MDLLFKRYANPLMLLDNMIEQGRFTEFVREIYQIQRKELDDKQLWEIWLFRRPDIGWIEFLDEVADATPKEEPKPLDVETTLNNSLEMLEGFKLN